MALRLGARPFQGRIVLAPHCVLWVAFLLAAIVLVSSVPAIAQQSVSVVIEKTGKALSQTEDALDASRRITAKLDSQITESKWEVLHVRRELVHAAAEAQDIEARISALESNLAGLEDERRVKLAALERRRGELSWTLSALQRLGRKPPDLLIFTPASLREISHARLLLRNISGELDTRVEFLSEELLQMTRLSERILTQRNLIDLEAERLESQRAHLSVLLTQKTRAYDRAEAQHSRAEALVSALATEAENLHELLERLVAEQEQNEHTRRAVTAEAKTAVKDENITLAMAEQEGSMAVEPKRPPVPTESRQIASISMMVGPSSQEIQRAEPVIGQNPDSGALNQGEQTETVDENMSAVALAPVRPLVSAARGTFTMPARGVLVGSFDETTDLGLSTKGIVIETRSGAQIIAPYDGRIAFAGRFREYGLLLIIDHGEGYHSLIAGMGRIDVTVGQGVLAGEPVGVMRSDADSSPRLYVELRSDGQPINPLPWVAVETINVSG